MGAGRLPCGARTAPLGECVVFDTSGRIGRRLVIPGRSWARDTCAPPDDAHWRVAKDPARDRCRRRSGGAQRDVGGSSERGGCAERSVRGDATTQRCSGSGGSRRRTAVSRETIATAENEEAGDAMQSAAHGDENPGIGKDELAEHFGAAYPTIERFADRLRDEGELRGLIGPREVPRIWDRHILNSAAVVPFLPLEGLIADVGSGAGLPGIVIAAMRPNAAVYLIEPMERRCAWLTEVATDLELTNVEVKRGRAEEYHGAFECDAVTSRAVAALDKLVRLSLPLVRPGGEMIVLKGRNVARELDPARKALRRLKGSEPEILEAPTIPGVESTTVVRIVRQTGAR